MILSFSSNIGNEILNCCYICPVNICQCNEYTCADISYRYKGWLLYLSFGLNHTLIGHWRANQNSSFAFIFSLLRRVENIWQWYMTVNLINTDVPFRFNIRLPKLLLYIFLKRIIKRYVVLYLKTYFLIYCNRYLKQRYLIYTKCLFFYTKHQKFDNMISTGLCCMFRLRHSVKLFKRCFMIIKIIFI